MYSRRSRLAAFTFTFRVAKTKALISCAFTAQLICVFVFAYADYWFSDAVAQFSCDLLTGLSYQENPCLHIIRICFFIRIRFFFFFFFFLGETSTMGGCFLWVCCSGSTRRLNRKEVLGEARDRTCDPWFTRRVT